MESLNTARTGPIDVNGCASRAGNSERLVRFDWKVYNGHAFVTEVVSHNCRDVLVRRLTDTWTTWRINLTVTRSDGHIAFTNMTARFRDLLIASLGDSAASGEGNPEIPVHGIHLCAPPITTCGSPSSAEWAPGAGLRCDRSGLAASAQAALALETASQSVTFWHLACSGASITDNSVTASLTKPDSVTCVHPPRGNSYCRFRLSVTSTGLATIPAGAHGTLGTGDSAVQFSFVDAIPPSSTTLSGIYPGTTPRVFPAGTPVVLDDYGNGGVLTPYDGENKPGGVMCSGAGMPEPGCHQPLPSQLTELKTLDTAAGRPLDALLLTIGANDVDWTPLVADCYGLFTNFSCVQKHAAEILPRLTNPQDGTVGFLPDRFAALADGLAASSVVAPQRVFLTGYWDATADKADGGQNQPCQNILEGPPSATPTGATRAWGQAKVIRPLNTILSEQPRRFGWSWIPGIDRLFYGHGICAPFRNSWIVTPATSTGEHGQGDINGAWHANGAGQTAIAQLLVRYMTPALSDPAPTPPPPPPPVISIQSPAAGTTIEPPAYVTLTAVTSAPNQDPVQISWTDTAHDALGTGNPLRALFTNCCGTDIITATAHDLATGETSNAQVTIGLEPFQ